MSNSPYTPPVQFTPTQPSVAVKRSVVVRRLDPVSTGAMLGGVYVLIGLIIGGVMSLAAVLGVAFGGGEDAAAGLFVGLGAILFIPLFYGVLGFIGGLVMALIYNAVAHFIGGIRIELEG
jgi:hypothetical protein